MTSRAFVFTWNNPPYKVHQEADVESQDWKDPPYGWPSVKYAVWQYEIGKECGTPHYQGYIVLEKPARISWLVENMPTGISWDVRRGTHEEAKAYNTKEDTRADGPWEFGEEPKQGKRSDLAEAAEFTKTHTTKEVAEAFPSLFIRYNRGLIAYRNVVKFTERADDVKTELIIYWGVRGSGKSHMAKALYPGYFSLMRPRTKDGGCWWDGYEQQDTVLIDEFFGWLSPDLLCRLNDKGKAQVETKFGFVSFNSKRIVITSNEDPWFWWKSEYHGMVRRLEEATINYFPDKLPKPVPEGFEPESVTPADPRYPPRTDVYYEPPDAYAQMVMHTVQIQERNHELFIESSGQYGQPLGGPPPTMKERIRRAWETDEDHNDKE